MFGPILFGLVTTGFLTGVLLVLLSWCGARLRETGAGLAAGVAMAAGFWTVLGKVGHWPAEAQQWLSWIAIFVGSISFLLGWVKPRLVYYLLWAGCWGMAMVSFMTSIWQYGWSGWERVVWTAGIIVFGVGLQSALETSGRYHPETLLFTQTLLSVFNALCLFLSGSILFGQLSGIIGMAIGIAWILGWFFPLTAGASGIGVVSFILQSCLLAMGVYFSELTAVAGLLLFVAPAFLLLSRISWLAGKPQWIRLGAGLIFVVGLGTAAVIYSWMHAPPGGY